MITVLVSCASKNKTNNQTTDLPFSIVGKTEAMPTFQNGLRLLHNFEYIDAAESFIEAQKIDPQFTMAYWGEAMTYNHPVWGDLDVDKARKALLKLGETKEQRIAKATTALEKDFISSIEILYGEGTKTEREKQYSEFLSQMYKKYNDETEVAAFYSLSLLGLKKVWTKMEDYNYEAEKIAKEILTKNPSHPGALHYMIHADDHPDFANKALSAANSYSKVASYAGHALHMPSHIYLALGMWNDVVSSNEVSWQASVDKKLKKNLDNDRLDYHAHLWLSYGYLQQGRYNDALNVIRNQQKLTTESTSPKSRFALLFMKAHYLIETLDWQSELSNLEVESKDLALASRTANNYVNGSKAFYLKRPEALEAIIKEVETDVSKTKQFKLENEKITVCGVTPFINKIPTQDELYCAENLLGQLQAMSAWLKNDNINAENIFQKIIKNSKGYLTGPPSDIKPVHELFGEFYLATNRPDKAYEQFESSLKNTPNRLLSLKGKLKAAKEMGNKEEIEEIQNGIDNQLKSTDTKIAKL